MLDLKLIVVTTHGEREEFNLAEMWDYYNENFDDEGVSFGDYLSGAVWNWAAYSGPSPMLIHAWLDHVDLAEYVIIDKPSLRPAFAEIESILRWIDDDVNLDKTFGLHQALAFLTYVGDNGWEFINFDEIDNFMEDTYCGAYPSAWSYVAEELIGNRFIAGIPNWLKGAVDEEVAVSNLKEQGLMETYDGRRDVYIFRQ